MYTLVRRFIKTGIMFLILGVALWLFPRAAKGDERYTPSRAAASYWILATATAARLNVTVHVLAAFVWLGGMFFLAAVGAPVLRTVEPQRERIELFRQIGGRFRRIGWIAIGVLLVTGVGNLRLHGISSWSVLGDGNFWATPYGTALGWKLGAVAVMIGISAMHDFVLGPMASRLRSGSPEALRARRGAAWLARVNALVGIIVVFAAVRLARGG